MLQRSLVAKVQRRQLPDVGMLFLNLNIRRAHIVSDSLNEVSALQNVNNMTKKYTTLGFKFPLPLNFTSEDIDCTKVKSTINL